MSEPYNFKSRNGISTFLTDIDCCQIYQFDDSHHTYFILCQEEYSDKILIWLQYKKSSNEEFYEIEQCECPSAIYGSVTTLIWGLLISNKKLMIRDEYLPDIIELWIKNAKAIYPYVTIFNRDCYLYIENNKIPEDAIRKENKIYRAYRDGHLLLPHLLTFRNPYYI